jgi:hypothetical protein
MAAPSEDAQAVVLWDLRQRAELRRLRQPSTSHRAGMCMCLRFLDAEQLLAGWEDGSVRRLHAPEASRPTIAAARARVRSPAVRRARR